MDRRTFITSAAIASAIKVSAQTHDPLIEVGRKHAHALERWCIAAEKPDAGNFDTPECEHWFKERWKHINALQDTIATSPEGVLAQMNMIKSEFGGDDFPYIEMEAETFDNIKAAIEGLAT